MDGLGPGGLTQDEAARRLRDIGPNEPPRSRTRDLSRILLETSREPMFMLLIGAAALYMVLGDLAEGAFLLAGALAAVGLVIFQELRSERALQALADLAQPTTRVIRDGLARRVPARELVPGDLMLVGEGDRLSADGVLLNGEVLRVDESMLTGESAPVVKHPSGRRSDGVAPDAEADAHVFAGTMVVAGQGVVRVSQTGAASALGRISASLAGIPHELTPLQATTGRIVTLVGLFALAFCALVAIAYGAMRSDWIGGLLAGITVAIALVPEEFPMVLAVFLALGAWRLARHNVLVRRSAVVETLGGASVLCVDKTGTLTENRMQVARVWTSAGEGEPDAALPLSQAQRYTLTIARLASATLPVDPMDRALHESAGTSDETDRVGREPERIWPLRHDRLAVIQSWRTASGHRLLAAKGAPEAIFDLCRLSDMERERLHHVILSYAGEGLRVLGVAFSEAADVTDDPAGAGLTFAGLVGFADPLRADVPAALREAEGAGIRIVMITGDHPETARAIAGRAGIDVSAGVLTGSDIAGLSFDALCERLRAVRVFARIAPQQKLRIVEAFKANGEIVAMTGDGVNDAPALEAAHIGVAMGRKGTDVAREAADLVLQDDSFSSIVGGVRMGRRIFSNLRRAMIFITAVHIPIAGLALLPILMGLPLLLFPMHVVLLELVIDPVCALVFEVEPSEQSAMRRPPRRSGEALFGVRQIMLALLQGVSVLAGVLSVYAWASLAASEAEARATGFTTLVVAVLVLALTNAAGPGRILAPHRGIFWLIAAAVTIIMTLTLLFPPLASVFSFQPPEAGLLIIAVIAGLAVGGWMIPLNRLAQRSS